MATLTGRIVLPNSPEYPEARQQFNRRFQRFPLVINFCQSAADVANAIRWVRETGTPFRVRSGRHSYEAFSNLDGGLVIDISEMTGFAFDQGQNQVWIGAGWEIGPLYERLWQEGVTIPAGTAKDTGISGLTLGGGIGLLSRQFGLTIDNLLGVEYVDARGNVIVANEVQNPDLFWASRGGGGGNFGVATALHFRTHPIDQVGYYEIRWPREQFPLAFAAYQTWAPQTDERLTATIEVNAGKGVLAVGQFNGPRRELERLLQPQLVGRPTSVLIEEIPYIESVRRFAAADPPPIPFKNSGGMVYQPLPPRALQIVMEELAAAPGQDVGVWSQAFRGAVSRIPSDATAYVHRPAILCVEYIAHWQEPEQAAAHVAWVDRLRERLRPFTRGTYVNWPDLAIRDWPSAYYGANWGRLRQVKQAYDPENLFQFAQSIPPAARPLAVEHVRSR